MSAPLPPGESLADREVALTLGPVALRSARRAPGLRYQAQSRSDQRGTPLASKAYLRTGVGAKRLAGGRTLLGPRDTRS